MGALSMGYGRLAVGVVVALAAMSSEAAAQEARRLKFGLRAQVEHDSNVARLNESAASLRGLSQGDTIFTPSATVDFLSPVGRHSVFLKGAAGYTFYDKNKRLERERLDFTGGANVAAGPCRTTLTGGYARGIYQADDPLLLTLVENIQETKRAAIDVGCSRSTGLGLVFNAGKNWVSNDLAVLRQSDYDTTSLMAGVSYVRPALGKVTLFANRQKTEYPKRPINDGYELTSVGLTFDRQLGARIQGSATIALTSVDQLASPPPGVGDGNLDSTTYALRLTYRASNRLRFQGSLDKSVTPSAGLGRTYDVSTAYRFGADYDLGSRINIALGASQVERDSAGVLPTPIIVLTDSKTNVVYGSIRYKQSQRISWSLNASHEERTTNTPQFDYTSDRIGVAADVTF